MTWWELSLLVVGALWIVLVGVAVAFRQVLRSRERRDGAR